MGLLMSLTMRTDHPAELAYLLHTKRLKPSQIVLVNEIAYWYDEQEVNNAIEHAKSWLANAAKWRGS